MTSFAIRLRWPAAFLTLVGALLLPRILAAPAPAPAEPDAQTAAEKIRRALDQTVSLSLVNEPLKGALDHLRERTKVNFILDQATLQQMGIDTGGEESLPVNVNVKDARARTALRTMLSQYNLGYAIINDSVVVTTTEMAIYRQLRQAVSLDLESVPLHTALKRLARQTGTNVMLDPRVPKEGQAPVTLQLDEVPLETAVRLLAELAGLRAARLGNVLFVTTDARAERLRAEPELALPGQGGDAMPLKISIDKVIAAPAAPPAPAPAEKKEK